MTASYQQVCDIQESIWLRHQPLDNEAKRLAFRTEWEAALKEAGWTEEMFLDECERRILGKPEPTQLALIPVLPKRA